ncbi:hypothetical protein AVEN_441-1 [Araneus ventricosus]|uniref:Uncharacterized protein n=1 Tax=Araneus ventricosus TaxID=182803 RepID=A0A4Y2IWQ2_ARAVE|nr:hypothetical protein AVEN_441-1 [Araneus ventricosus]
MGIRVPLGVCEGPVGGTRTSGCTRRTSWVYAEDQLGYAYPWVYEKDQLGVREGPDGDVIKPIIRYVCRLDAG